MAGLDSETKDDKMTKQLLRMWIPSKHFCQLHKEYKIIAAGVRTKDGLGHLKDNKATRPLWMYQVLFLSLRLPSYACST